MKLALSQISTVNASFAEDVSAYAAAGFDGIGIWEMKLPADDTANRALLREAGLGVANCVPTVPSILPLLLPGMEGPPDPAERIAALCASMRRLAAYDPESVLCLTGPIGDLDAAGARERVVAGLREVAAAAREAGVRFGLEPAHPGQHDTVSFVNTIADALALLDEAGLDDVGIMVDTYNLWHERPEAIAAIADRVTGLHVADEPPGPQPAPIACSRAKAAPARPSTSVRSSKRAGTAFSTSRSSRHPIASGDCPVDEAARRAHAAVSRLRE